ncbi:MAG: fructokinase [Candidatus Parabeggiatoa sp. nov. 3]|nr:MAG: fructokinase [Gammaproteobacteria bacterium]RKZ66315.1 MAG: fructokinase [Gammaproteobacteria bacterium]RKZ80202.1 MAG: fructokinase [Gammaproteobacteria bacterium]
MSLRIGVDLGGTKIEVIALDKLGETLARERVPTPQGDYGATVLAIADLVVRVEGRLGAESLVGVAMPGALSPATGLIKNANSTCLIGQPLDRDLSAILQRQVKLSNDANCFALSEAVDGAAAGAAVVFGVIIGTGTGGGVVVNRMVLEGPNAIAGEWGHNPLPWPLAEELPGPSCYCGKSGCIETFLSGPGMVRDFQAMSGLSKTPFDIVALADAGDQGAAACLSRYVDRLARGLASIINVLDPNVIVLGGGMSNIERLYTEVPRLWGRYVFSDRVDTVLRRAKHGDSSGVRGAAWLWPIDCEMG